MLTKLTRNIGYILIALLFTACEETDPEVTFEKPIKGRFVDLSRKIGKSITVTDGRDTVSYSFSYNRKSKINSIVRSNKDTVFVGTVTKRNEIFLLNRELEDGRYAIHALHFDDTSIVGLESEWLQSLQISFELEKGNFIELIKDTTGIPTLLSDKKMTRELFRTVLKSMASLKIMDDNELLQGEIDKGRVQKNEENESFIDEEEKLLRKVYPNPFSNQITIELYDDAPYTFQLYNLNGELIKTSKMSTNKMEMFLPHIPSGTYILKVSSTDMQKIDEIRIVKS